MILVLKAPYGLIRAPEPSLMSGTSPSCFGGSTCKRRTGATASMTAGAAAGVCADVSGASNVDNARPERSPKTRVMMSASFGWFFPFQGLLIRSARIAPGDFAIPPWMMRPGPCFDYSAADHRAERAGFARCALVNVDHKSGQHDQSRDVVEHIADCGQCAWDSLIEPHRYSCNEEDGGAEGDGPKIQLLAAVEEPCVLRR